MFSEARIASQYDDPLYPDQRDFTIPEIPIHPLPPHAVQMWSKLLNLEICNKNSFWFIPWKNIGRQILIDQIGRIFKDRMVRQHLYPSTPYNDTHLIHNRVASFVDGQQLSTEQARWALYDPKTSFILGFIGLRCDPENPYKAIRGTVLDGTRIGQGNGFLATSTITRVGFENGLHEICADVHPDNIASNAMNRKLGKEPWLTMTLGNTPDGMNLYTYTPRE